MSQGKKHKKRRISKGGAAQADALKSGVSKGSAPKSPPSKPDSSTAKPKRRVGQRWVDPDRIEEHRAGQRRRTIIYRSVIAVVIAVVVGTVGWVVYRNQLPSGLPDHEATPPANYAVPAGATRAGVTVGQPDAPVAVDLYVDFECPYCRDYERTTAEYFDEQVQAGTVKLTYHPISFLNGYSVWAAAATGCASEANAVPSFTTEVFAQDGRLDREQLVAVGENVGLTSPEFAQCVRKSTYQDWALGVTQEAVEANVARTPTVTVNGEAIAAGRSLEDFVAKTQKAVADAATAARDGEPGQ